MKRISSIGAFLFLISAASFAQTNTAQQNAAQAKDAPVDVSITDFKKNSLPHEIVVFRSQLSQQEYQGMSQDNGKFSLRLPAGDRYEIFILGFKDSTSYNLMEIPALGPNASYKKPFSVDIQFQPARTFVLDNVNFETAKAELKPESFPVLDELVAFLNRKDDEKIEIGGYTDNVGKPATNLSLSQARAKSVMDYVISKGIDPNRLTSKGYGMSGFIADNSTAEGRAQNRRTEVKILE